MISPFLCFFGDGVRQLCFPQYCVAQDLQKRMSQWSENELNNYLVGILGKLSKAPKLKLKTYQNVLNFSPSNLEP